MQYSKIMIISVQVPGNSLPLLVALIYLQWNLQGRSHQIWGGQVSGACVSTQDLGGLGACPPENFGNLESMRLLLRPFLGQNDAYQRPDGDRVLHA